jgi:hypothetical protein
VTLAVAISGLTSAGGGGAPSTAKSIMLPRPLSGSTVANATPVTPGTPRRRCSSSGARRRIAAPSGYAGPCSDVRNVSSRSAWNPFGTRVIAAKLRMSRPAPISSITASAISATTRPERIAMPGAAGAAGPIAFAPRLRQRPTRSPAAPAADRRSGS